MTRHADLSNAEFGARMGSHSIQSRRDRTLAAAPRAAPAPAAAPAVDATAAKLRGGRELQPPSTPPPPSASPTMAPSYQPPPASASMTPPPASASNTATRTPTATRTAAPTPPPSVNWTALGYVNPSEYTGDYCNSAYASSTTGTVEARWKQVHGGALLKGSTQEIVDCAETWGNNHCLGGDPWQMMAFIITYGLQSGAPGYYTLTGTTGPCQALLYNPPILGMTSQVQVTPYSIPDLMASLTVGPTIMSIYTMQEGVRFYESGIVDDRYYCDGITFDNYWLGTGYGSKDLGNGQYLDYWILRSDWGGDYGEVGHIRIARTDDWLGAGLCGTQRDAMRAN